MSYAHQIIASYFQRTSRPPDSHLDGLYQYEMAVLRDTLTRLEAVLDDEGVPRETAERVIRCMLYGAPSPAATEERIRREAEVTDLLATRPMEIQVRERPPGEVRDRLLGGPLPPDLAQALAGEIAPEGT